MKKTKQNPGSAVAKSGSIPDYSKLLREIADVLTAGRRQAAWTLNAIMCAVYWDIGRRIVEFEQKGEKKAPYGVQLI